jgi:hypothetical protein
VPLHVEALEPRCLLAADVDLAVQEAAFPQPPEPCPAGLAEDASIEAAVSIPIELQGVVVSWPELDPSFAVDDWYDIDAWDSVPAMQESWITLPYWRSVVGGDGPDPESEDSVGPIAFCSFPGSDPFFKGQTGDPGIDAPDDSDDGDFGEIVTLTEVDGPEPCFSASALPEVLPADIGLTARPHDAIPSPATTAADGPKSRPPVMTAFAGLPGALASSGFAGFGAATSAGDAGWDAGFGVRRRVRR